MTMKTRMAMKTTRNSTQLLFLPSPSYHHHLYQHLYQHLYHHRCSCQKASQEVPL
jgi:hypothetical protein